MNRRKSSPDDQAPRLRGVASLKFLCIGLTFGVGTATAGFADEDSKLESYRQHLREVVAELGRSKLDGSNSIPKDWTVKEVRALLLELKKAKRIRVASLRGVKYIESVGLGQQVTTEDGKEPEIIIATEEGEGEAKSGAVISLRLVRDRFAVVDIATWEE